MLRCTISDSAAPPTPEARYARTVCLSTSRSASSWARGPSVARTKSAASESLSTNAAAVAAPGSRSSTTPASNAMVPNSDEHRSARRWLSRNPSMPEEGGPTAMRSPGCSGTFGAPGAGNVDGTVHQAQASAVPGTTMSGAECEPTASAMARAADLTSAGSISPSPLTPGRKTRARCRPAMG